MTANTVREVFFILGLASLAFGVYDVFGVGFASISVSIVLLAVSVYGTITDVSG